MTKQTKPRGLEQSESRWRLFGLAPSVSAAIVFLVVPMLFVLAFSLLKKGTYGGVEFEFSLEAYKNILFSENLDGSLELNTSFAIIFFRSVSLAAITTILCLLIAYPVAFYISRQKGNVKSILLVLVMIPFWSNLLVRTASWIILLRDKGIINDLLIFLGFINEPIALLYTNGAVLVGLVYVYIPFMILPLYTVTERLNTDLIEASFDLYAGRLRALWHVIFPLTLPGIISGSILVFIPSIGAFITPDLLGGGKNLMVGTLIQLQFSSGRNWPYGSSLSVLMMAIVLTTLFLWARKASKPS